MKLKKMKLCMDTVVDIQVLIEEESQSELAEQKVNLAFEAFYQVEAACSRFSRDSELMKASQIIGEPVLISPYLFQPLKFALEISKETDGLFDPSVGKALEDLGFNRHYLTGEYKTSLAENDVTFKDIVLDGEAQTVLFQKPMVVDLGAVAKGFAIDLAADQLKEFPGFLVNAGGDLFAGGLDESGEKWKIGIQHPFKKEHVIEMIELSNEAICTSGSYERKNKQEPGEHHIINAHTKKSPNNWVSCSVIAPFAMMADAFSTAVFLLDPERGKELIEDIGGRGVFITPELQRVRIGGI